MSRPPGPHAAPALRSRTSWPARPSFSLVTPGRAQGPAPATRTIHDILRDGRHARPGPCPCLRSRLHGRQPIHPVGAAHDAVDAAVLALAVGTQGLFLARPPRRRPAPHRGLLRRARLRRRPRRHLRRRRCRRRTRWRLHFTSSRGCPSTSRRSQTFGLEVLPEPVRARVLGEIGLTAGAVRTRAAVDRARELARTALQEEGYPYARVAVLEAEAPEGRDVALTVAAEAGPTAVFGPLTIAGESAVGERRHPPPAGLRARRSLQAQPRRREPAAALRPRALRLRQHRRAQPAGAAGGSADTGQRHGGQSPSGEGGGRLRERGAGPHRRHA